MQEHFEKVIGRLRTLEGLIERLQTVESGGGGSTPVGGWTELSDAWTYATSTSVTVGGDLTGILSFGMKVRYWQTAYKYAYIQTVVHAGGTTTLTLSPVGGDTVANAAITLPAYSTAESPFGFPLPPAVLARRTSDQTIGNASNTAISFQSTYYDTDSMYDAGAPTRLTCKTPGIYQFNAAVAWGSSGTGERKIDLRVNGGTWIRSQRLRAHGSTWIDVSGEWEMTLNDYIEMIVYQTSGGNLAAAALNDQSPVMGATWQRLLSN